MVELGVEVELAFVVVDVEVEVAFVVADVEAFEEVAVPGRHWL